MRALLLAAGIGSRLRPLTDYLPKCLVPIRGRPLLDYWLELLLSGGVDEVLVNAHHHADVVEAFVAASPWSRQVKVVREAHLLGTAGTVLRNRIFLEGGPFLVAHADNLTVFDPREFIRAHARRPRGTELTMMTFTTPDAKSCGVVQVDGQGIVRVFQEKAREPVGNTANAAVYVVEPSVMSYLEGLNKEFIDFSTEVLPHYVGRTFTFHNEVYHRDIGTLESLRAAQSDFPLPMGACANAFWHEIMARDGDELRGRIERLLAPSRIG